jgi:hypothetical protein
MFDTMRPPTGRLACPIATIVVALGLVLLLAGGVSADDKPARSGLIVSFDEDSIEFYVLELPAAEIDGYELLELAGLDLEVHPFSGLGEAICAVNGHGCPSSDCFCESFSSPAYFWQYFLHDDGQWVPQHRGARAHTVADGEIHGWAWTAGQPDLPDLSWDELLELAREPVGERSPESDERVEQPGETPDPEATPGSDETADRRDSSEARCALFIGSTGLLLTGVIWGGARRYRKSNTP